MAVKIVYRVLRAISDWAMYAFYSEVWVEGKENVQPNGPLILSPSHHNELIDIVALATQIPHRRIVDYWAKSSLFNNPILRAIMFSSGSIPVDRKTKDKQTLFKATFEALSCGESIGIFPEGTSYTEPRIVQVKDGVAWAALEYMKWAKEKSLDGPGIVVVPVGIVYSDKSKFRSRVLVLFGKPISMDNYAEEFLSPSEGASRAAVKRLCYDIEQQMMRLTVNAPDWDTLYAARMMRDLLWNDEKAIPLKSFMTISQTLIDIFADPHPSPALTKLKSHLLQYYSLLHHARLTHSSLSSIPMQSGPVLWRLLFTLFRLTVMELLRVPLFLVPLIVHLPAYILSTAGERIAKDEEEARAQFKVVFGGLGLLTAYPVFGWTVWTFFKRRVFTEDISGKYGLTSDVSAIVVLGWLVSLWHNALIDRNYNLLKHLMSVWKVSLGLFSSPSSDVPPAALDHYLMPPLPPVNPFITKAADPPPTRPKPPAVPARRLIRHLLRARAQAARSAAVFFAELDATDKHVSASVHPSVSVNGAPGEHQGSAESTGIGHAPGKGRSGKQVTEFLRRNGVHFCHLSSAY